MSQASPAVAGSSIIGARSFAFAFNGSGGAAVAKAIGQGGYYLVADVAFWVKLGLTAATPVVAVPGTTQPAAGSENDTAYVPALTPYPLDVTGAAMSMSVLGATTTAGTLQVSGPMSFSNVK